MDLQGRGRERGRESGIVRVSGGREEVSGLQPSVSESLHKTLPRRWDGGAAAAAEEGDV